MTAFDKVFGLGLSRTGTTSLGKALDLLGIRTSHYPYDATTLREIREGSGRLTLLERYRAIVDISIVPIWRRLDQAYPGSKFILTVRDKGSWQRSMKRHYEKLAAGWSSFDAQFREFTEFISRAVYGSSEYDEALFGEAYDRHRREVLDHFGSRPGDLLVLDVVRGGGWRELCSFLGRPEPEVDFPHSNKGTGGLELWADWSRRIAALRSALESRVPPQGRVILVDDGKLDLALGGGRTAVPFPERDGHYDGPPAGDAAALAELDRMRRAGVRFLAFAWTAFWWLDHYPGFCRHLRATCACLAEDELHVLFELAPASAGG